MGHFCGICKFSGIPINPNNRTVVVPFTNIGGILAINGTVLRGEYNEYGFIENINETLTLPVYQSVKNIPDEVCETINSINTDPDMIENYGEYFLIKESVFELIKTIGRSYSFEYYGKMKTKSYTAKYDYSGNVNNVVEFIWNNRETFINNIDKALVNVPVVDLSVYEKDYADLPEKERKIIINSIRDALNGKDDVKLNKIDSLFSMEVHKSVKNVSTHSMLQALFTTDLNGTRQFSLGDHLPYVSAFAVNEKYFIHYYVYMLLKDSKDSLHKFITCYAELYDLFNGLLVLNKHIDGTTLKYNLTQDRDKQHIKAQTKFYGELTKILKTI